MNITYPKPDILAASVANGPPAYISVPQYSTPGKGRRKQRIEPSGPASLFGGSGSVNWGAVIGVMAGIAVVGAVAYMIHKRNSKK